MAEWVPTHDGRPLKLSDALLDWGYQLMLENGRLREERDQLQADLFTAVEAALTNER